jgi:hypothetical protein
MRVFFRSKRVSWPWPVKGAKLAPLTRRRVILTLLLLKGETESEP